MVNYQFRGMVCGCGVGVFFSVSLKRKNTRASSFYRCFSILRSRKCGIIYTRFHTFIWWRKTGMLNFLFFFIPAYPHWHSIIFINFLLEFLLRPRLLASNAFLYTTHINILTVPQCKNCSWSTRCISFFSKRLCFFFEFSSFCNLEFSQIFAEKPQK